MYDGVHAALLVHLENGTQKRGWTVQFDLDRICCRMQRDVHPSRSCTRAVTCVVSHIMHELVMLAN